MRPTTHDWAMGVAELTAQRSTCARRAVGCVLLNSRNHIIATGYNGVAAGQPHCNEITSADVKTFTVGATPVNSMVVAEHYANACPGALSPSGTNLDGCRAIHAEQNALLQCQDVYKISACYVTTAPCMTCIKLLLNTSCQTIFYREAYAQPEALELWRQAGREVRQL